MVARTRSLAVLGCALLTVFAAVPVSAQIEDQISAYTGANAEGYLEPLALAMGANLNSALFHSAYIPLEGLHISLETPVMAAMFDDEAGTFSASVEGGFEPLSDPGDATVEAPTVVGDGGAVIVDGVAGTAFAFPGGFDLNSFALAVPQLRIGSVKGTEALVRYIAIDAGDVEVGNVNLWGLGARHNVSQYLGPDAPVDLAAGFMYQNFELGDELISATAFSFGVQVSKRFPSGFAIIEPYAGLSYDTFQMDVSYVDGDDVPVELSFDSYSTAHLTAGLHAQAAFFSLYGEYNIAEQSGLAFGMSLGF